MASNRWWPWKRFYENNRTGLIAAAAVIIAGAVLGAVRAEDENTEMSATAPASGHYANCSEARAAGVAPIMRGQAGYRAGLDPDGDGVACEPWRATLNVPRSLH